MPLEEKKRLELINKIAANINSIDIVVDSLEDALKIAFKYQESGKYNLFRGQSGLWSVISTFNRYSNDEQFEWQEKIALLRAWAKEEFNIEDEDTICAIAQHYSIPTNFVDFSLDPKVAAFFASTVSENNSEPNEYSCIICINEEELNKIVEIHKNDLLKDKPIPQIISIDVSNLWHLEAQKGKFLYLPFIGFEISMPYKRIIFKRDDNNITKFNKTDYWPDRKSILEQKFMGYIQQLNLLKSTKLIEEFSNQLSSFISINVEPSSYNQNAVFEKRLLNFSWDMDVLAKWKKENIEKYEDINNNINITLEIGKDNLKYNLYEQIVNEMNNNSLLRNSLVNWNINTTNIVLKDFSDYANKIWDGMRMLPYSNEDIASVMSRLIDYIFLLHNVRGSEQVSFDDETAKILRKNFTIEKENTTKRLYKEDIKEIINDYIELELHNNISCINKAFVSRKSLRKAMRNDLDKLIKFAINDNNMDLELVLVHIRQANLLYEFEKLKSLFVESIILTQLFSYDENFIIYSPADLKWIA